MMSRTTDVLIDSFVCYQDLSEYVGLENIKRGFHGELQLHLALQQDIFLESEFYTKR